MNKIIRKKNKTGYRKRIGFKSVDIIIIISRLEKVHLESLNVRTLLKDLRNSVPRLTNFQHARSSL